MEVLIVNSGIGIDYKFWALLQTKFKGQTVHAVLETVRLFRVGEEIDTSKTILQKAKWMSFSSTSHLKAEKEEFFFPVKFGINSKFKFGQYTGYEIGLIYALDPAYIEWCIFNVPYFYVSELDELQEYGIIRLNESYAYRDLNYPEIIPLINSFRSIQEITKKIGMANISYRLSNEAIEKNKEKIQM